MRIAARVIAANVIARVWDMLAMAVSSFGSYNGKACLRETPEDSGWSVFVVSERSHTEALPRPIRQHPGYTTV